VAHLDLDGGESARHQFAHASFIEPNGKAADVSDSNVGRSPDRTRARAKAFRPAAMPILSLNAARSWSHHQWSRRQIKLLPPCCPPQ